MSDPALTAVEARTNAYLRTRDAGLLLDRQATVEADALVRDALPSLSPRGLGRRPCEAAHVLGWFHYARFTASNDPDDLADLGLALFLFDANRSTGGLPPPVDRMLGAEPDAEFQAHSASRLVAFGAARADPYAIAAAIALLDRLQAAAEDPIDRGWHLADLGHAHHVLFSHTDLDEDLQASIDRAEQALVVLDDHPYRAVPLINLSGGYLDRFHRTDDVVNLERSVERGERAVRALPPDNPHRAGPLTTLGRAYRLLFERTGVVTHIDAAIDRVEQAVAASPADDPQLAERRSNLGRCHVVRYERLRRPDDLDAGIACAQQALADSVRPAQQALCHADLAAAHLRRFQRTAELRDADTAIEHGERARRERPDDVILLGDLVAAYEKRFEHTRRTGDITTAFDHADHALALARDPAERARRLSNLGVVHQARFRVLGEVVDLHRAVDYSRRAVAESPASARAGHEANLVAALLRRYDRLGDPDDVETALHVGRRSVAAALPGDPNRAQSLANLGTAYRSRYELTGDPSDLQTGIELAGQALAAIPVSDPALPSRLWNMASGPDAMFRRTRDPEDLAPAIEYGEKALAAAPPDDLDRAMYLADLGVMHRDRFVEGGRDDHTDLDAAVDYGERSVAATPPGDPRRGLYLSNLGAAHASRYQISGAAADLEAAIDRCEQSLALTPPGHPARAGSLSDLAYAYTLGPDLPSTKAKRDAAVRLSGYATGLEASPPMSRVRAARVMGAALTRWGATEDAASQYRTAVRGLRQITPRDLSRPEQEYRVGWHHGLVGEAMAAQLAVGDPGGAVEVAEMGRGILLSAALDTRTEVIELEEQCPDLAGEFHALRTELNAHDDQAVDAAGRRELAARWSRLLERIRDSPGFERFLEPPRLADLRCAAAGGAVVVVAPAPSRSDAIVLDGDRIQVVPLPRLTVDALLEHGNALLDATRATSLAGSLARGRAIPRVLAWLWDAVAAPVLDALGHHAPPVDGRPWPRVWWVPTGAVSLFPLHAAGAPGGPAVIDRVVSSYAPTIRALQYSRSRPPARTRRQLIVAVSRAPERPDLPDLRSITGEARRLHAGWHDGCLLVDDAATTAAVTTALTHSTWVHLACHATTDPTTPSRGGLVLYDATLTVPRISAVRPESAELAYLSACATAQGQGRLLDEAIHMASAFQLAGYRHVIATLWPIDDAVAAGAARRFYDGLPDSPSADAAPHALHALAHDLRGEHPDRPDLWASFIHCGP